MLTLEREVGGVFFCLELSKRAMFKAVAASKSRGPGDDEPSEGSSPIVLRPDLLLS